MDLFDGLYSSPQQKKQRVKSIGSDVSEAENGFNSASSGDEINGPQASVNRNSPQMSCCSSDLDEFENLKSIEKQIFKSGDKEKVPIYLKEEHPPKEGKPCRDYLLNQKKWGERPPAESFMHIAN